MIHFTFKGHKISIHNSDWRKLKERFDPNRAKRDDDDFSEAFLIPGKCPLCIRHRKDNYDDCWECPVNKINPGGTCGGTLIIDSFFKKIKFVYNKKGIWWSKQVNRQARRQLKAILRRMEKIEQSQRGV